MSFFFIQHHSHVSQLVSMDCYGRRRSRMWVFVWLHETETQIKHDRPWLTVGYLQIRAQRNSLHEDPLMEKANYRYNFLHHVVNKLSVMYFQAIPWHQPGGVWWWRSLWNYRWLWDWTQLWLWSIREGKALCFYVVPFIDIFTHF